MRILIKLKFEFRASSKVREMASCEKSRCSSYNEDLRWRIIWQRFALNLKVVRIAENLNISISTVKRVINKFEISGSVAKKTYPAERAHRKITEPIQFFVLHRPGVLLREIVNEVKANFHLEITESAICKFVKKMNFTRQKLANYAIQQDKNLREQYRSDVFICEPI